MEKTIKDPFPYKMFKVEGDSLIPIGFTATEQQGPDRLIKNLKILERQKPHTKHVVTKVTHIIIAETIPQMEAVKEAVK